MSKHSTPEEKLKVSSELRPNHVGHRRRLNADKKIGPPIPPKGTNANNQYR